MMYKILIADDEEWIRKAIVKRVLSFDLDLEIIGQASDGKEAYQLALDLKPDIIITDIRMPYMNGLELIEQLKEDLPSAKVIVISGYADFEYARTALQLKVCQYILKTVDDNVLKEAIQEAIRQIENEATFLGEFHFLQSQLAERTYIMQKYFIQDLISSSTITEEYIRYMIKNLGLSFNMDYYFCILVLELDKSISRNKQLGEYIEDIKNFIIGENYTGFVFENQQGYNELNILLYSARDDNFHKQFISNLVDKMQKEFCNILSWIGISDPYNGCLKLDRAYIEAMDALKNKKISKNGKKYYTHFSDISIDSNFTTYLTSADERNLAHYIETSNSEDMMACISTIFKNIKQNGKISTKLLTKLYYEIIVLLENILGKYQISVEQVLETDFLSLIHAPKITSLESLEELLKSFSLKVLEHLSQQNKNDPKILLNNIKTYIETNYFEPITLDIITQKFFISKAYFSQLFKRETDMTFISYLTSIRMKHAIDLLKNNNLKVHEVAKMVGYSDPLYFGQVFKKYFGVLPSEY